MELRQTQVFEHDVKKLDGSIKQRLKKSLEKIISAPTGGKPLKHFHNVFSERIENYRLAYRVKDNEILLICFKNRDEVYEYLKQHWQNT